MGNLFLIIQMKFILAIVGLTQAATVADLATCTVGTSVCTNAKTHACCAFTDAASAAKAACVLPAANAAKVAAGTVAGGTCSSTNCAYSAKCALPAGSVSIAATAAAVATAIYNLA